MSIRSWPPPAPARRRPRGRREPAPPAAAGRPRAPRRAPPRVRVGVTHLGADLDPPSTARTNTGRRPPCSTRLTDTLSVSITATISRRQRRRPTRPSRRTRPSLGRWSPIAGTFSGGASRGRARRPAAAWPVRQRLRGGDGGAPHDASEAPTARHAVWRVLLFRGALRPPARGPPRVSRPRGSDAARDRLRAHEQCASPAFSAKTQRLRVPLEALR